MLRNNKIDSDWWKRLSSLLILCIIGGGLLIGLAMLSGSIVQSNVDLQQRVEKRLRWMEDLAALRASLDRLVGKKQQRVVGAQIGALNKLHSQIKKLHDGICNVDPPNTVMSARTDQALKRLAGLKAAFIKEELGNPALLNMRRLLFSDLNFIAAQVRGENRGLHEKLSARWSLLNVVAIAAIALIAALLCLIALAYRNGRRLKRDISALEVVSTRDELTGLWNKVALLSNLEEEIARCERENRPLSILMIDFDYFRQINNRYGLKAGDTILKVSAERMAQVLRPYDTIGRFGGEEFLIILPGCDIEQVEEIGERLRSMFNRLPIARFQDRKIVLTVSIGAATVQDWSRTYKGDTIINAAEKALSEAKRNGRNQLRLSTTFSPVGKLGMNS